jgi:hypothetical protein
MGSARSVGEVPACGRFVAQEYLLLTTNVPPESGTIAGMTPSGLPDHTSCDLRWLRPAQVKLAAMSRFLRRPAVVSMLVVLFVVLAVQGDAGMGLLPATLVVAFECLLVWFVKTFVEQVLAKHHVPKPPEYEFPPAAPLRPSFIPPVPTPPPRVL